MPASPSIALLTDAASAATVVAWPDTFAHRVWSCTHPFASPAWSRSPVRRSSFRTRIAIVTRIAATQRIRRVISRTMPANWQAPLTTCKRTWRRLPAPHLQSAPPRVSPSAIMARRNAGPAPAPMAERRRSALQRTRAGRFARRAAPARSASPIATASSNVRRATAPLVRAFRVPRTRTAHRRSVAPVACATTLP